MKKDIYFFKKKLTFYLKKGIRKKKRLLKNIYLQYQVLIYSSSTEFITCTHRQLDQG